MNDRFVRWKLEQAQDGLVSWIREGQGRDRKLLARLQGSEVGAFFVISASVSRSEPSFKFFMTALLKSCGFEEC